SPLSLRHDPRRYRYERYDRARDQRRQDDGGLLVSHRLDRAADGHVLHSLEAVPARDQQLRFVRPAGDEPVGGRSVSAEEGREEKRTRGGLVASREVRPRCWRLACSNRGYAGLMALGSMKASSQMCPSRSSLLEKPSEVETSGARSGPEFIRGVSPGVK